MTNAEQRDRARRVVIGELLDGHRYEEAVGQYSLLKAKDDREIVRQNMVRVRESVQPEDRDYIERTVTRTRRWRSRFGRFSEDDAELVRLECQARVAAHHQDRVSFYQAVDEARCLIEDWSTADRCSALLSLGVISAEFGDEKRARELFGDALNSLFDAGRAEFGDPHFKVYFGLAAGDRFATIAEVMSGPELLHFCERLVAIDPDSDLLNPFGRGIGATGKIDVAHTLYKRLPQDEQKIRFSTGLLVGIAAGMRRLESPSSSKKPAEEDRKLSLAIIDRIIADKPPLEFKNTGKQRPKREYLGLYNVSRTCLPDSGGKIWREVNQLPELTLEEFVQVRAEVVLALWGHGSVYGFPTIEGSHDFFVWEDKFSDRTQKIEIEASDYLPDILPAAVADLQKVLARHPFWRIMVLGHGTRAEDQYFVVYPDAIRILQASEFDSMTEAIEANARLRASAQ